jgi:hydroxyacylglutathione hydrolase
LITCQARCTSASSGTTRRPAPSYLFGCNTVGKFAVVDAYLDLVDEYITAAESQGSEIVAVIETHIQADHLYRAGK